MENKDEMILFIMKRVNKSGVMEFISEEVYENLRFLNKYKLKNIIDSITDFLKEVKNLNDNYINSL